MQALTGTIVRLVLDKGFGFVRREDGTEFFFHRTAVRGADFDALVTGQRVTFEEGAGPKGPRASAVRIE